MRRAAWILFAICLARSVLAVGARAEAISALELRPDDRVLIVAPHPDDEIIGCAGVIQKALAMGLPLRVVFMTYGDNNEWSFMLYRKHPVFMPGSIRRLGVLRHDEAIAAAHELGVARDDLVFLGYPDFKTLTIWNQHWGLRAPEVSMLSRVNAVPYSTAMRPGALYKGEEIVADLKTVIAGFKPSKVFLSHPADHNADHRAAYLFTRIALWDLRLTPRLFPYMVHYRKWPRPRGFKPEEPLTPPEALSGTEWTVLPLSGEEVSVKQKALRKHWSQYISSRSYLESFVRSNELFGDFAAVRVRMNAPALELSDEQDAAGVEPPEELLTEERVSFVGIEKRFISLEDGNIVLTLRLSRPLGKVVRVSISLFGYRGDTAFSKLPKLRVVLDAFGYKALDNGRKIPSRKVRVKRRAREITLTVPLKVLGFPDRILTSANTYLGTVPLDWTSWRVVTLAPDE